MNRQQKRQQNRQKKRQRVIHCGWGTHKTLPNTYFCFAECDDEITTMTLINPTPAIRELLLIPYDAMEHSEEYRLLRLAHLDECEACTRYFPEGAIV